MMHIRWFFIFLFAISSSTGQKTIANSFHAWSVYTGSHKLSDKGMLYTEYQWRRADGYKNPQQSLVRLGLDYKVNGNLSVMAGYGWIKTYPYGIQPVLHDFNENRLFEQANIISAIGKVDIQHRYRIEQRWIDQYVKNSAGEIVQVDPIFRNRVRYRLMVLVPLTRKEKTNHIPFVQINDEVFVGIGKGIAKNPLDQNRFIAAIGWRFNASTNVQVGYLNQFIIKTNATDMERNHTLWLGLTHNLDFIQIIQKQ